MKKIVSALLAIAMVLSICAINVFAESVESQEVEAKFYLLNKGLNIPTGTAQEPKKNYSAAGTGKVIINDDTKNGYYNNSGVDAYVVSAPELELEDGQSVIWYVIKKEPDGWHVDGIIVPFVSFVYDSNGEGVTGSTTDAAHYYEGDTATVMQNSFVRSGYEFTGWNTKADGTGTSYAAGDKVDFSSLSSDGSISLVTLYAQWKATGLKHDDVGKNEKEVKIVCPKKMSVRFEDGTICSTGDKVVLEIGKEYKFQMCSNNWDNDKYTDDGDGICGTVVYTVKLSNSFDERSYDADTKTFVIPKGDPVLRTDVNKCFMAYRYHFKTDYNKQTGIEKVVNTPIESLSVNLPLGSTIKSDAYINFKYVGSDDVFIENNEDKTISYTDYMWTY